MIFTYMWGDSGVPTSTLHLENLGAEPRAGHRKTARPWGADHTWLTVAATVASRPSSAT